MVDNVDQMSLSTKKTNRMMWHAEAHPRDVSRGCFQYAKVGEC